MTRTILIAPPGIGKTSSIISRIATYLVGGGRPDRRGYVSMCYHLYGITPGQVVDDQHMQRFATGAGFSLSGSGCKD